MSTVVIVDDERSARVLIREYLSKYPQFEIIGEANNGFDAVEVLRDLKPDIVFLDVQMPGYTGFEVLAHLEEIPMVVFSTAFDSFAIKAFEVHAMDYLLKPYTQERFAKAITRIEATTNFDALSPFTEQLLQKDQKYPTRVLVNKNKKLLPLDVKEIYWIEAYGDYSKMHTTSGTAVSNSGISSLQEKFDPAIFMRVHRSYIVNITLIEEIRKNGNSFDILLQNGDLVPVSRRNARFVRKLIY